MFSGDRVSVLETGGQDGNKERNDDGNVIEAHRDPEAIFEQQAQAQIDRKKHADGQQRDGISFFHGISSKSQLFPIKHPINVSRRPRKVKKEPHRIFGAV